MRSPAVLLIAGEVDSVHPSMAAARREATSRRLERGTYAVVGRDIYTMSRRLARAYADGGAEAVVAAADEMGIPHG